MFEHPKSANLHILFPQINIFSGFISLCKIGYFCPCKYFIAFTISFTYFLVIYSENFPCIFNKSNKDPPSAYSNNKLSSSSLYKTS